MTQPSLTTTFDTSLIDLSLTPPTAESAKSATAAANSIFGNVPYAGRADGSFSTIETEVSDTAVSVAGSAGSGRAKERRAGDADDGRESASIARKDEEEDKKEVEENNNDDDGQGMVKIGEKGEESKSVKRTSKPKARLFSEIGGGNNDTDNGNDNDNNDNTGDDGNKSNRSNSNTKSPKVAQYRNHSQDGKSNKNKSPMAQDKTTTLHLPTEKAYDAWAPTYDTDGNFLQAVDDAELRAMLPHLLTRVLKENGPTKEEGCHSKNQTSTREEEHENQTLRIVDLGCGTGRNTLKLLTYDWPAEQHVSVVGLDCSAEMLTIARNKLDGLDTASERKKMKRETVTTEFHRWNFSSPSSSREETDSNDIPTTAGTIEPPTPTAHLANAAISTLVLEHLTLPSFFRALRACVRVAGLALVTNMHPDMGGKQAQAGFVDGQGRKVVGRSWIHGVEETVREAERAGFEVLDAGESEGEKDGGERADDGRKGGKGGGAVREVEVTEDMVLRLGERSKKWIGTKVWFGLLLRRAA